MLIGGIVRYFKQLVGLLLLSTNLWAQEIKFDDLWQNIKKNAGEIETSKRKNDQIKLELDRFKRHWVPNVSLGASHFETDDPTGVFFNNLGQASITQQDFIPSKLNSPKKHDFQKISLSLTLPLYEGGAKSKRVEMGQKLLDAQSLDLKAQEVMIYRELALKYGNILIHKKTNSDLNDLKTKVSSILNRYEQGSKSNLVGYSGLLGLKGVRNRILGMKSKTSAHLSNDANWIIVKANIDESWSPKSQGIEQFISVHLKSKSKKLPESTYLKSKTSKVKAMEFIPQMQKARFLPQVGFFARKDYYNGDRDSNDTSSLGIYMGWSLFDNESYGRVSEARASLLSAKASIKSGISREIIARRSLNSADTSLKRNIQLMNSSKTLLNDQTLVALKLFKRGKLSALQLAEVLNRRVDLIDQTQKVLLEYLKVNAQIYQISN